MLIFGNYPLAQIPQFTRQQGATCDSYDHQDSVRIDTSKPKINLQRLIPFVRYSIPVSRSTQPITINQ